MRTARLICLPQVVPYSSLVFLVDSVIGRWAFSNFSLQAPHPKRRRPMNIRVVRCAGPIRIPGAESCQPSGEAVTVDAGRTLIIDQDVDVGSLHVKGTAIVERRDISIGAEWILVEDTGALIAGTPNSRSSSGCISPCAREHRTEAHRPSAAGHQVSCGSQWRHDRSAWRSAHVMGPAGQQHGTGSRHTALGAARRLARRRTHRDRIRRRP